MLAIEGVGPVPLGANGQPVMPSVPPPPFIGFDNFALGFARVVFLVATIASFAAVRIVAGLLLALAPLFAARSDEHTSELQSLMRISYAVFCLKKKKKQITTTTHHYQISDINVTIT